MTFEEMDVYEQRDWALSNLHTAHVIIADLNNKLSVKKQNLEKKTIREHYDLTLSEASFITILYSARGGVVTYDYISHLMPHAGANRTSLTAQARRARRALDDVSAILNIRSAGYSMAHSWVEKFDLLFPRED